MLEKKRVVNILGVLVLLVVAFMVGYIIPSERSTSSASALQYNSQVCVYKNGELVGCSHNLLYNNGQNLTRDLLGIGSAGSAPVLNISLCNSTAGCDTPNAGASEVYSNYTNCGLANVQGTYGTISPVPGNWSVWKTFTSTCTGVLVNATRLTNVTGGVFAGNTFSVVNLSTNDQLTINWTLMIT